MVVFKQEPQPPEEWVRPAEISVGQIRVQEEEYDSDSTVCTESWNDVLEDERASLRLHNGQILDNSSSEDGGVLCPDDYQPEGEEM